MSDTWDEIQAIKNKQISLKERIAAKKRQIAELSSSAVSLEPSVNSASDLAVASPNTAERVVGNISSAASSPLCAGSIPQNDDQALPSTPNSTHKFKPEQLLKAETLKEVEKLVLTEIIDISLNLPVDVKSLHQSLKRNVPEVEIPLSSVENLIQKYNVQSLITINTDNELHGTIVETVDHKKLTALYELEFKGLESEGCSKECVKRNLKRKLEEKEEMDSNKNSKSNKKMDSSKSDQFIESLLSSQSAKERENKKLTEDILQLLSRPTTKERLLTERFRSQGGRQVREFCSSGTREECQKNSGQTCVKLHFKKIIHKHTDESLGDCSFLNTCFHMDTCKYVHYQIDYSDGNDSSNSKSALALTQRQSLVPTTNRLWSDMSGASKFNDSSTTLYPPQWIQCDLRHFDMSVLGKFAVVMADPPWDIHMELPYGTMSDDEMRKLNVPVLQDDGYIFLWVTGRAMELGRECLTLWGYERVDELIWVKTNQLQRIIRTGRTGHWLNHGKEHCLVGAKGNLKGVNRGLDCDVIVSEVRATSHKPDEIYGIIERLSPGMRKIELFGRPHNIQPNWVTLGNQVDGVKLMDPEVVRAFRARYPEGLPMK